MNSFINLEQVTLISVTSVDVDLAMNALIVSSEYLKFGSIKLLSPAKPADLPNSIEHILIPPIDFLGYSKFIIEELHKYVDTQFCLVIQADGFVINPQLWNKKFFEYDYIGAPWPNVVFRISLVDGRLNGNFSFENNFVGNGGFSLRSKKLLELCSEIKFDELTFEVKSEDVIICHFFYEKMTRAGIKFAPPDLASSFSIELAVDYLNNDITKCFGFHGKHWLDNCHLAKLAKNSNFSREFMALLKTQPIFDASTLKKRVGRLDPCPCCSGKRFKDCHGKIL
jgi:hypothetical protein